MRLRTSPFAAASWRWLAFLPAIICTSCSGGPKLNPVHGKVLFKGQPLEGATVTFNLKEPTNDPHTLLPRGVTESDGTFSLTTGQNDGAVSGDYIVTVTCVEAVDKKKGAKKVMAMQQLELGDRFKGAYANPKTSKIKVTIKDGTNELEPFSLE